MAEVRKSNTEFILSFAYDKREKEFIIEHYDDDDELEAVYTGAEFGDLLRHVIYDVDPVLAAAAWTKDYLEFSENHQIVDDDEDEE